MQEEKIVKPEVGQELYVVNGRHHSRHIVVKVGREYFYSRQGQTGFDHKFPLRSWQNSDNGTLMTAYTSEQEYLDETEVKRLACLIRKHVEHLTDFKCLRAQLQACADILGLTNKE